MMEENPILLWKIKCCKQKTSGKADLQTMYYLYITHTHTLSIYGSFPILVWNYLNYTFVLGRGFTPFCHFLLPYPVLYMDSGKMSPCWCWCVLFFFPVERWNQVRFFFFVVTSDKGLTGQFILSISACAGSSLFSSVRLILEYAD